MVNKNSDIKIQDNKGFVVLIVFTLVLLAIGILGSIYK